ncbi:Response regulator receiver domain-containing protein [Beijerinckiaceae bacterium RH AL1]|nr:response regulator [Beijerinckiaceae bacterium]VVB47903.1 Response regulator receiver domain-containing protein [Beijerinckiaceae bacterium RH CH11]VVB47980.1 Response regulator receiver domain-containing protein [Beijerinckiaceae bacterium RH AL8]VVC56123.1 Response regulator receiver domain-containing protein [Beijerinckiaceae bacterium RH AL1]
MEDQRPSPDPYAVVVDDNPVILLFATEILTAAGFSVFAAADAAEAQAWFQQHGDAIVLLFTNVELGDGLNGFALARQVAARWPRTGILVSSGQLVPQAGDMPADAAFLPKPFIGSDVVARARDVVELKRPGLVEVHQLAF